MEGEGDKVGVGGEVWVGDELGVGEREGEGVEEEFSSTLKVMVCAVVIWYSIGGELP